MNLSTQPSLFDYPDLWVTSPREAFAAFVQQPAFLQLSKRPLSEEELANQGPLRASSAQIYMLMFGKFVSWLEASRPGTTLYQVAPGDIAAFLQSGQPGAAKASERPLTSKIRVRYVRLLERVFAHLALSPNPARAVSIELFEQARSNARATGSELPMQVLPEEEQRRFLQALPEAPAAAPGSVPSRGWRLRRDRAMLALLLGAGLKVSEVLGIETEAIGAPDVSGSVRVKVTPASTRGSSEFHHSQLRAFAAPEVLAWVQERRRLEIPGKLLFPAHTNGKPLNKTSLYLAVQRTFERAEITIQRRGGRTLRNSFAVRELQTESVEAVGQLLGHRIRKSTETYDRAKKALERKRKSSVKST